MWSKKLLILQSGHQNQELLSFESMAGPSSQYTLYAIKTLIVLNSSSEYLISYCITVIVNITIAVICIKYIFVQKLKKTFDTMKLFKLRIILKNYEI